MERASLGTPSGGPMPCIGCFSAFFRSKCMRAFLALLACTCSIWPVSAATRLKDLVSIEGVRENQLIGYGIVVGLNKTGDKQQTIFSTQSLANMLERMGVAVSSTSIKVADTAAVMVTATLPPFA